MIETGEQEPLDILGVATTNPHPAGVRVDEFTPELACLHNAECARESEDTGDQQGWSCAASACEHEGKNLDAREEQYKVAGPLAPGLVRVDCGGDTRYGLDRDVGVLARPRGHDHSDHSQQNEGGGRRPGEGKTACER